MTVSISQAAMNAFAGISKTICVPCLIETAAEMIGVTIESAFGIVGAVTGPITQGKKALEYANLTSDIVVAGYKQRTQANSPYGQYLSLQVEELRSRPFSDVLKETIRDSYMMTGGFHGEKAIETDLREGARRAGVRLK